MHPLEEYLKQNNLEALTIAMLARVRYLAVYLAANGYSIGPREAEKIRQVAHRLTGMVYGRRLITIDE